MKRRHPRTKILLILASLCLAGALFHRAARFIRDRQESRREELLLPAIREAAYRHGLESSLVRALVWKESRFRADAVGSKGEIGLMQITGGAVADWARRNRKPTPTRAQLFNPEVNLEIGCWYLSLSQKHWDGYASRRILELAEYNAGRTKVLKDWKPEKPEDEVPLDAITFPGTQDYIRQILVRQEHYKKLEKEPPAIGASRMK